MNDKHYKKDFYDTMYGSGRTAMSPAGDTLLDVLFRRLRKFELHRGDAVASLITPCERLLDLGCGNGSFLFKIGGKAKELYGADISPVRIAEAETAQASVPDGSRVHFKAVDLDGPLPYNDSSFDVITCRATLEHLYDPFSFIREISRILKQDGVFIVEVPNITWLPRRISFLFGGLPRTSNEAGWDGGHLHYFTVRRLRAFLKEHGYRIMHVTGSGIFSRLRTTWVSMLSGDIIIKAKKK